MKNYYLLRRFLPIIILSLTFVTLFSISSFAGEGEKMAWNIILPEESNIALQQHRVINSFEITLTELDSVIEKAIQDGKITNDTDFTRNKDVSIVYDYLAYRIYELIKVDRRIREEFANQEMSIEKGNASSEVVNQYYTMKADYEHKGAGFFSSLDNFKRTIFIKDIKSEIKNLKSSIGDLRSAMNHYSSYSIAIAAR